MKFKQLKLIRVPNQLVFLSILGAQITTVFLLYFLLPGKVPITQTAFQPDSINSFCLAYKLFGEDERVLDQLPKILEHFAIEEKYTKCSGDITTPYRTRIMLPSLIWIFSHFNIWWTLLLPSIIIYFVIGKIFYEIVKEKSGVSVFRYMASTFPFYSPHVGWFAATIMTEGPTILFLLLILYYLKQSDVNSSTLIYKLSVFGTCALVSRQVWPIVATLLFTHLIASFRKSGLEQKRWKVLQVLITAAPFLLVFLINSYISKQNLGPQEKNWSIPSIVMSYSEAFRGIILGLRSDFGNVIEFYDLFFLVNVLCCIALAMRLSFQTSFILSVFLFHGLTTMGIVYLADGSYGQNWRFLCLLNFLFFAIVNTFENPRRQTQPLLEPK